MEIKFPLEVEKIIEFVKWNLPTPEQTIRECRRKIYLIDHMTVNIYDPDFEEQMELYKKARRALLDIINSCRKELRSELK